MDNEKKDDRPKARSSEQNQPGNTLSIGHVMVQAREALREALFRGTPLAEPKPPLKK